MDIINNCNLSFYIKLTITSRLHAHSIAYHISTNHCIMYLASYLHNKSYGQSSISLVHKCVVVIQINVRSTQQASITICNYTSTNRQNPTSQQTWQNWIYIMKTIWQFLWNLTFKDKDFSTFNPNKSTFITN